MPDILKLIRIKNLLIIAATQYLMRYAVIASFLNYRGYNLEFGHFNFFLLVLTTLLIAAAGYVINDYFDTKTDILNRPQSIIVGKTISRQTAMILHVVLNLLGLLLGFYISYAVGIWKLVYIYIMITGLLWFYSSAFKRQFLIGNIIVALLVAIVPLMPALYEVAQLNEIYRKGLILLHTNFNGIFHWIAGFSVFAFLTNLIREIIKDTEDFEGDKAYGRRSIPVISGIKRTKTVIISLIGLSTVLLILSWIFFVRIKMEIPILQWVSALYFLIAILLPFALVAIKVIKAEEKEDWTLASKLAKWVMLFGILFALIIRFSYDALQV
ncbi:MAG: geranylgeranylglycerol-phosphate geranylgeranyltransferase [Bacteroidota bacterium]|nr:geranylgeranylglycerol-phosphate geranylgeranyltransferase [Bacteroidota bacterium]